MNRRNELSKKAAKIPKFADENKEAEWWASAAGRRFLRGQTTARTAIARWRLPSLQARHP